MCYCGGNEDLVVSKRFGGARKPTATSREGSSVRIVSRGRTHNKRENRAGKHTKRKVKRAGLTFAWCRKLVVCLLASKSGLLRDCVPLFLMRARCVLKSTSTANARIVPVQSTAASRTSYADFADGSPCQCKDCAVSTRFAQLEGTLASRFSGISILNFQSTQGACHAPRQICFVSAQSVRTKNAAVSCREWRFPQPSQHNSLTNGLYNKENLAGAVPSGASPLATTKIVPVSTTRCALGGHQFSGLLFSS